MLFATHPWMSPIVDSFDLYRHHLCVGLGGPQMTVAQQLLDVTDISAGLQKMRCTSTAERVGRYRLFDSGFKAVFA